ncbi:DUF1929 domain-containing protein [bacterium]|nr:DUF1929 domain-containing protein [bacterium]
MILTLEPPYSLEQKVAVFGGGGAEENFVAVANCEYVDFASPTPAWTSMSALNTARARADAVLLPDGNVLVVGGGDYVSGAGPWQAVKESEMFYPATETFVPMDSNQGERIYHSQALLLPDGRVVASGNDRAQTFGGYLDGDTYEIYWPPYLFTSSGWAARPTIDTFDGNVHYGQPMFVDYTKPSGTTIEDVVLVAPGAVTHGLNFSQRRATMEFVDDGSTITATAPWAPEVAPPGDYLLFIVTDGGVPSEGKFVRLSPATSTAVTGSRTVWGGTVRLGSTFTVEDGDSLVVLSGTRVYADKDADPPVRLQVNGMIDVQGGAGAAEVLFSSYDPATGDLDTGAWGGLEFHLDGAEDAYGYFGSLEPPSSIVGAAIAHADTAIRFTDLCAPTLEDIRFENITSGIDILLDDTDVMIPSGYWDPPPPDADSLLHEVPAEWVFADTLDVRATSSSSNDWGWPGGTWGTVDEPGKPDLLVQGRMAVSGVVPNTFLPEVPASPSLGSDWGGITFMTPSSGNRLYNAHVSGAVNPVRVIAVDQSAGTEVKNCLIEQFRDVGVGIKGSQYVEVSGCTIRRGGNMLAEAEDVAETGISIEESAPRIDDNTIFDTEDVGIQIMNATGPSKFECIAVPANPESLLVTGNQIEAGSHSVGSANGIDASWICAFYEAQVQENYIEHWGGAGIKMHQCVNTKVSCNEIRDCGISFRYERTDLADQPPVRLQHNNLQDCATDLVHTDSGKKLKLGPSTAYTGSNRLDMEGGNELFVRQNDPSSESSHRLNAESCAWAVNEADADSATVIQYVDGQSPLIPKVELDATPPSWQNAQIMCLPQDQTPEQEARLAGGPNESQVPWETDPSRSVADLPFVPGLQVVGPNPARGPVSLLLGVQGAQEHISVTVYDVSGRRVRTIRSGVLPGGMHRLVWNLRDDGGNLAAPGAYFVRTQRSANVENHKIIVVR